MNRYLVTGASGFIGRRLCEIIKDQNPSCIIKGLMNHQKPGPWNEATFFDLKAVDSQSLPDDLTKNIDTVLHLAGIAHASPSCFIADDIYHTVNVKATEKLLEQALQNKVKRFIYVSSIKAIGQPQDAYGRSKQAAEKIVLDCGRSTSMQVCILRPVLVYGPGVKGNLSNMLRGIDHGWFPPLPETHNQRSLISVDDVVTAILLVSDTEQSNGKIYTITDGEIYSTKQLYDGMCRALGKEPNKITCPLVVLKGAAILGDLLEKLLARMLPMNSRVLGKLLESALYQDDMIQKELGWMPKYNFFQVLPSIVSAYRSSKQNVL